jgi:hypothetical protein
MYRRYGVNFAPDLLSTRSKLNDSAYYEGRKNHYDIVATTNQVVKGAKLALFHL